MEHELSLSEALVQIEQLRAQLAAELEAKARLQETLDLRNAAHTSMELRLAQKLESVGRFAGGLAHEIDTPIQYVGDSVHFLRTAFEDLSELFHGYRDALTELKSSHTSAAALLADLRELEIECDLEFLSVEVPRALERTLEGAERVAGIVRAMKEFAHPNGAEQRAQPSVSESHRQRGACDP